MPRLPEHISFTMIPNFILDENLEFLSEGELKILLIIYRKTVGFDKKSDKISYSQLIKNTGLSKSTISQGIKGLENKKLVKVDRSGITHRYTYCLPKVNSPGSSNIEPELVQKSNTQLVQNSNIQKKLPKETERNTTSSSCLSEDLCEVANYWNNVFPGTLNHSDSKLISKIEEALDEFSKEEIKTAIFNRNNCSYYRDNHPQMLKKPSAFFPYLETIANDLRRKPERIYDYDEMAALVSSSSLTTDDFEMIPEITDKKGQPMWKTKNKKLKQSQHPNPNSYEKLYSNYL